MTEQDILRELARQLGGKTKDARLKTSDVRSVSAAVYKQIEAKELNRVLNLAETLLRLRKWEYGVIAYDWAFRVREQYTEETFIIFERWLKSYVTGWGDCDDFCTHALGALIAQHNELFPRVPLWTSHENFAVRRAAAVALIYPIRKNRLGEIDPFIISDLLMNDPHYLVLKGYGWMLKVLSQYRRDAVKAYLAMNASRMPRLALRYAIEKMNGRDRAQFMIRK